LEPAKTALNDMPSERSSDVKFEIGHVSSPPEPAIGDQLK